MCRDCGCHSAGGQSHTHEPRVPASSARVIRVQRAILEENDRRAERNRETFRARGLSVLNVLSSPGSGKTELLRRTLVDLGDRLRVAVIVGDLETDNDARRLRESGRPAVQIQTGGLCHLEADMVARAAGGLDLDRLDLLFIENVGNLVCPASYDLGEGERVVLLAVTEGEDKPLKYPAAFATAGIVLLSKIDLAGAVGFDREAALTNIRRVAPGATILEVSARSGQGLDRWYEYLEGGVAHDPVA